MNGGEGRLIAAFDVGTTATKGILIDARRGILAEGEAGYPTYHGDGTVEQAPDAWWAALRTIAQEFWRGGHDPHAVAAVALTGQMQDVVVLDRERHALGQAVLYSDARAGADSTAARAALEAAGVSAVEAAAVDAASPLAKLLWLQVHEPERMAACQRVLFGAKDYLLARLTGVCATDATTAGTTACLDPLRREWRTSWCRHLGVPPSWLPDLRPAGTLVGGVCADAAADTGFARGTPVATGLGDAAAATLAAGLVAPGATYLYLGTSAWAAALVPSSAVAASGRGAAGVFYLPYIVGDTLIAAAPLLNAGSAHHWIMAVLGLGGEGGQDSSNDLSSAFDYEGFEALLRTTPNRSGGALFLPYLNGERCPVQERRPTGTFVRLGARTGRGELAWAVLEGIGFSLRQVLEILAPVGTLAGDVHLVGGMARSVTFRQLVADICGVRTRVPPLAGAGSALAAAVPVAVTLGWFPGVEEAVAAWFPASNAEAVEPDPGWAQSYAALYGTYSQVYPLVSRLGT